MAIERFPISRDLEVRVSPAARQRLAEIGVQREEAQDHCYTVLAEGLAAVERSRAVEALSAAAIRAEYLASQ